MTRPALTLEAVEKSTYVVTLTFTDAEDTTAISSRTNVVATPGASVVIVLSGNDLALQTGETPPVRRLLTVQATYSSTEGAGLPLKEEYAFTLRGLTVVA